MGAERSPSCTDPTRLMNEQENGLCEHQLSNNICIIQYQIWICAVRSGCAGELAWDRNARNGRRRSKAHANPRYCVGMASSSGQHGSMSKHYAGDDCGMAIWH